MMVSMGKAYNQRFYSVWQRVLNVEELNGSE